MIDFELHADLKRDCFAVTQLPLCDVLLMNNANFPWLILVPRRVGVRELFDLEPHEYAKVCQEIRMVAEKLSAHTNAHKMNIAALGNITPQLHIHIIARSQNDAAWPQPVWNCGVPAKPYTASELDAVIQQLRNITNL